MMVISRKSLRLNARHTALLLRCLSSVTTTSMMDQTQNKKQKTIVFRTQLKLQGSAILLTLTTPKVNLTKGLRGSGRKAIHLLLYQQHPRDQHVEVSSLLDKNLIPMSSAQTLRQQFYLDLPLRNSRQLALYENNCSNSTGNMTLSF